MLYAIKTKKHGWLAIEKYRKNGKYLLTYEELKKSVKIVNNILKCRKSKITLINIYDDQGIYSGSHIQQSGSEFIKNLIKDIQYEKEFDKILNNE